MSPARQCHKIHTYLKWFSTRSVRHTRLSASGSHAAAAAEEEEKVLLLSLSLMGSAPATASSWKPLPGGGCENRERRWVGAVINTETTCVDDTHRTRLPAGIFAAAPRPTRSAPDVCVGDHGA